MTPFLLAAALFAAEPKAAPPKTIIFGEDDVIKADLATPDVEEFNLHARPGFQPLIKIRENFRDKMKELPVIALTAMLLFAEPKPPVQRLDLTGSEIKGVVDRPTVDPITVYTRPIFNNLIKLRANFDDKIVKSMDEM